MLTLLTSLCLPLGFPAGEASGHAFEEGWSAQFNRNLRGVQHLLQPCGHCPGHRWLWRLWHFSDESDTGHLHNTIHQLPWALSPCLPVLCNTLFLLSPSSVELRLNCSVLLCSTHPSSQAEFSLEILSLSRQWPPHRRHRPPHGRLVWRGGGQSQSQWRGRCCKCGVVWCVRNFWSKPSVCAFLISHFLCCYNLHSLLRSADK